MRGENTPRPSSSAPFAVGALVLVPLVYVLSIGPAAAMCPQRSSCPSLMPMLMTLYAPLLALEDTALEPALRRWIELWH